MGGNLFLDVNRIDTPTYHIIIDKLKKELNDILKCVSLYPIKFYEEKESHGDIDIIVIIENDKACGNIDKILKDKYKNIIKNSNTYSFVYENVQVDLIIINENITSCYQLFYDYNIVGNLIGKLAHSIGLKFSPDGLYYSLYCGIKKEILITNDIREIFRILDLSYDYYYQSEIAFKNLDDIFSFISKSKYFNFTNFLTSNLTSKKRHRDKKRHFQIYDEWLINTKIVNTNINYKIIPIYEHLKLLKINDNKINDIICEYNKLVKDVTTSKMVKEKFSGKFILDNYPNLMGEELGYYLNKFKKILHKNYQKFILDNNIDDIKIYFDNIVLNAIQDKFIIFLDLDGVLITTAPYKEYNIDAINALEYLIKLLKNTYSMEIGIILTTAHIKNKSLTDIKNTFMNTMFYDEIIGTIDISGEKSENIKTFIEDNNLKNYIIIDDSKYENIYDDSKFILCEFDVGLTFNLINIFFSK